MEGATRKTGIAALGDAPWGAHLCLFYETSQDLLDALTPYFQAGLENNELCMWVCSDPISVEEARKSLQSALPDLHDYTAEGRIELLHHRQWYTKSGKLQPDEVMRGWLEKEAEALRRGFDGLRVAGDVSSLNGGNWREFMEYEAAVDGAISLRRMLAVCAYPLDQRGAEEIVDLVSSHGYVLVARGGHCGVVENAQRKRLEAQLRQREEHFQVERRTAEHALRESEERMHKVFRSSPDALAIASLHDGLIMDVNDAFTRITGYRREESVGRTTVELGLWTDSDQRNKAMRILSRRGSIHDLEYPFRNKWRQTCFGLFSAERIEIAGQPCVLMAMKDITDRKRAEEELRRSRELLEATFASLNDAAFIVDAHRTEIVDCNPAASEIFGYPRQEMLGRSTAFLHIDPAGLKEFRRKLGAAVAKPGRLGHFEFQMKRKDGSVFPTEHSVTPLRDEQGDPMGWVSVVRDITERRRAEEALRESEERYHTLFEQAAESIVLIDPETGGLAEFNQRAHENLGYTREEFKQLRLFDIEARESPKEIAAHIREDLGKDGSAFETKQRTKSGEVREIQVRTRVISLAGRKFIQGIWSDVTERKETERQILAYHHRLRSLAARLARIEEQERRRIASGLHDTVGQALAVLRIKFGQLGELAFAPEAAGAIEQIRDLLEQTIEDTKSLTFDLSPPILYELGLEPAIEWLVEKIAADHALRFEFEVDGLPKPLDDEIAASIFRSARELLMNVVAHAGASHVNVRVHRQNDLVYLDVEDDGVGMNPSAIEPRRGGGFGLFSVRERMAHLGGRLEIDSQPGKGTRATLVVPLERANTPTEGGAT